MQFVSKAKHDMKSVIHVDGTSRVQLVRENCDSPIRKILEAWYEKTRCPMLLNTSLNIKGEPMVDTREDADEFERKYNVKVF
jgi:carbamoyltransferase